MRRPTVQGAARRAHSNKFRHHEAATGRFGRQQNTPPRTLFGLGDQEQNPCRLWIEHLSRGGLLQLLNTHHPRNPSTGAPAAAANAAV